MEIITKAFENKRLLICAAITLIMLLTIVGIIYLLFVKPMSKEVETTLNVVVGALLASYHKVIEFWFKRDTDDSEHRAADTEIK